MISVDISACGNCRQIQPGDFLLAGDTVYLYSHGYFVEVLTGEKRIPDNVRAGCGDAAPVSIDFHTTVLLDRDGFVLQKFSNIGDDETFVYCGILYIKATSECLVARNLMEQQFDGVDQDAEVIPCDVKLIVKPLTR